MTKWGVHFANACGQLDGLIKPISASIADARARVEAVTAPVSLDIVIQSWPDRVIPEIGFVGYALTRELIQLNVDPSNQNLSENLDEPMARLVAHEVNHLLRMRGPGYGRTLGQALVSEGLAGRFAQQLYASKPEPWEAALDNLALGAAARRAATEWDDERYDHDDWFFGVRGGPRWAGYSLGFSLVGLASDRRTNETAAQLTTTSADDFRRYLSELV